MTESMTASFWVIGGNVIYSAPRGRADSRSLQVSLEINEAVVEYVSKSHSSHVQIEDYAQMTGSDSKTRRAFVERMDSTESLSTLIFCNLSTALSIAVNLGKRFNAHDKGVHVVRTYRDAIQLAATLDPVERPIVSAPIDMRGYACEETTTLQVADVDSNVGYSLEMPDWSIQGLRIDGSTLHTHNNGFLRSRHISALEKHRRQIDVLTRDEGGIDYVVVNLSNVTGASHAARIEYMRTLRQWHRDTPFRMYVAYGADRLQQTALILGRALMPFKVHVAKNREAAFRLICQDKQQIASTENEEQVAETRQATYEDLQDFITYLGRISWDKGDQVADDVIAPDHPLLMLYQSVSLVQEEIGELFEERQKIEAQLYQARKMETVGRFAAGVAHDINNILCIISGNTQLALLELDKKNPVAGYLKDAKKATDRAEDVVKQLLEFSRTQNHNHRPMDAVAIISDALRLLRATIPANVTVSENLPDAAITISTDSTQINQILMNLFANAAHAMTESGGTLQVAVSKEFVLDSAIGSFSERRAGEFLQLVVSDTGAGIDSQYIDQIFDPYFTTKGVGKGSGLGLAVVAGIVKAHGGSISVRSEAEKGTTFTLLFPVVNEAPKAIPEPSSSLAYGTESLLIVEDEVAVAAVMQKMLSRLGYNVEAITNPNDAIEHYRSNPDRFDLIITDMTMPSMTGVELAKDARAIRENVPVIICTGHSPLIDDKKAEQLGISALAMKPLELQDLATIVRSVLDAHLQAQSQAAKLH